MQSLLTESSDEKDILIIILWQIQNKEDYMIKEAIVKIVNKGDLSYDELHAIFEDEKALKDDLRTLIEGGFVVVLDKYSLRKGYVDSLMNFIKTPCGCTK